MHGSMFIIVAFVIFSLSYQIRDFTVEPGVRGCRVVMAVISRIEKSGIFSHHNLMLNRKRDALEKITKLK